MKMLMAIFFNSFLNSSSCLSAFLLFCRLSALFLCPASSCACFFMFQHGVDSKAYLATALWCCGFVRLWLWVWGAVVQHTFHSFPFSSMQFISPCFFCLIVLCALGPHLHCTMVLYYCNHAIYSPAGLWFCVVLFPLGFG